MITIKQLEKKQREQREKDVEKFSKEWEKTTNQFESRLKKLNVEKNDYDKRNFYWRDWGFEKRYKDYDKKTTDFFEKRRLQQIKEKNELKVLLDRYKHQQSEVVEAKKKLGQPGFTQAYLKRMQMNVNQTKRMIKKYE